MTGRSSPASAPGPRHRRGARDPRRRASSTRPASGRRGPDRPFGAARSAVVPSRGSHILVPRDRLPVRGGITLRVPGRVVFMVPWPRHWIIGTTDAPYRGSVEHPRPAATRSIDHRTVNRAMDVDLSRDDVVGTYAGTASAGRAVRDGFDGRPQPASPRRARSRTGSSGQRRQVHDLPGDGPRCDRRVPGRRGEAPTERDGGAAAHGSLTLPEHPHGRRRARPGEHGLSDESRRASSTGTGRMRRRCCRRSRPPISSGRSRQGFPILEAEIAWAAQRELALGLDDVLARRMRLVQELPTVAPRSRRGWPRSSGASSAGTRRGRRPRSRHSAHAAREFGLPAASPGETEGALRLVDPTGIGGTEPA